MELETLSLMSHSLMDIGLGLWSLSYISSSNDYIVLQIYSALRSSPYLFWLFAYMFWETMTCKIHWRMAWVFQGWYVDDKASKRKKEGQERDTVRSSIQWPNYFWVDNNEKGQATLEKLRLWGDMSSLDIDRDWYWPTHPKKTPALPT